MHIIRKALLKLFSVVNIGDISIRHHHTGDTIRLHSFRHKGYWYYGKQREGETMAMFSRLLRPGDTVVEVGGHIGYVTLYLAKLVGITGRVLVFEPGSNNLTYLKRNIGGFANITLVEKAATDFIGVADFFIENLTGQNNSLLPDYKVFNANRDQAGASYIEKRTVQVACTTLDNVLNELRMPIPALVKIDVEGAELSVLRGMTETLKREQTALMVEVTENQIEVFSLLRKEGFLVFSPKKTIIERASELSGNVFCVKTGDPRVETVFLTHNS